MRVYCSDDQHHLHDMMAVLKTNALSIAKRLFHYRSLATGLTFFLFYFGIPSSVSDNDRAELREIEIKEPESGVLNLSNTLSSLEQTQLLDTALQRFVEKQGVVGTTVGIVKDGRLVYAKGFGYTDLETQTPVEPYHLFRIGSLSKLITAVAIMKLREEGKLSLEDKVLGPEGLLHTKLYRKIRDKKANQITVEHLLSHTAGWSKRTYGDPMFIPLKIAEEMDVPAPADLDAIIAFILSKPIPYRAGTRYDYSNFGYCLLGRVIEAVSGQPYEEYVQENLLEPLGIVGMRLAKNRPEDRFADEVGYFDLSVNNVRPSIYATGEIVSNAYSFNIEALGAAGGWLATPTDLLRFLVAVDGFKTTPDILSNESLMAMIEPASGRPYGWRGARIGGTWWRTGTLAGTTAVMKRFENGTSWVALSNTSNRRSDYFNSRITYLLETELSRLSEWPNHDLFAVSY